MRSGIGRIVFARTAKTTEADLRRVSGVIPAPDEWTLLHEAAHVVAAYTVSMFRSRYSFGFERDSLWVAPEVESAPDPKNEKELLGLYLFEVAASLGPMYVMDLPSGPDISIVFDVIDYFEKEFERDVLDLCVSEWSYFTLANVSKFQESCKELIAYITKESPRMLEAAVRIALQSASMKPPYERHEIPEEELDKVAGDLKRLWSPHWEKILKQMRPAVKSE